MDGRIAVREMERDLTSPPDWRRPTQACRVIRVRDSIGPDPERHLAAIRRYREAGFDHLVLIGIGPDQEGFMRFWCDELAPRLREEM